MSLNCHLPLFNRHLRRHKAGKGHTAPKRRVQCNSVVEKVFEYLGQPGQTTEVRPSVKSLAKLTRILKLRRLLLSSRVRLVLHGTLPDPDFSNTSSSTATPSSFGLAQRETQPVAPRKQNTGGEKPHHFLRVKIEEIGTSFPVYVTAARLKKPTISRARHFCSPNSQRRTIWDAREGHINGSFCSSSSK